MSDITARDIMHPRISLHAKDKGEDVVKKLMGCYSALPVVNDDFEVTGIVSEHDILLAIKEERTIHEFSAESIMTCGHVEHSGVCEEPITITPDTPIERIVDLMYSNNITVLPVVENRRLVGIIGRKNILNAMAEKGFWAEVELRMRT